MWAVIVIQGVVIALLAMLVVGLLRSHAEILQKLHALGAGVYDDTPAGAAGRDSHVNLERGAHTSSDSAPAIAADLSGVTPDGRTTAVSVGGGEHQTLVAFLSSNCHTCRGFWAEFASQRDLGLPGPPSRLVIVTKGPAEEVPSDVARLAPRHHLTLMSSRSWERYSVPASPYFVLVDPHGGVVGQGAAGTWSQVRSLLQKAAADSGWPGGAPSPGRTRHRRFRDREAQADAELRAAGIEPGDPRLFDPSATPEPVRLTDGAPVADR